MSVTIESLSFWNGFTYRECLLSLDRQGLVYLNGRNGHGKSTPFEVMQHIFFGTTSRGIKKDGISCAVPTADGFLGEIILRNPDGRWLIRQARNHSRYRTIVKVMREVDGKWQLSWDGGGCPKKLEDAQKLAGSLLGLQQHEFVGCMYLSQASAHTLIEGTPSDKMRYIAQLFGLDVCDRMVDWLKRQLKEAERLASDAPVLEAEQARLSDDVAGYDVPRPEDLLVLQHAVVAAIEQKRRSRDVIYEARDRLASLSNREQLLEERRQLGRVSDYQQLHEQAGRLDDERSALRDLLRRIAERTQLRERLTELRVSGEPLDIDQIDQALLQAQERVAESADLADKLGERARIETAIAQLPANGDVESLRRGAELASEQRMSASLQLKQKQHEIGDLQHSIDSCSDGTCPTCRQPLDVSSMKKLLRRATKELTCFQAGLQEATERASDVGNRLIVAQQRIEYEQALGRLPAGDLRRVLVRQDEDRQAIELLRQRRQQAIDVSSIRRQLERLPENDKDVTDRSLAAVEAKLASVTAEMERSSRAALLDEQCARSAHIDRATEERTLRLAEQAEEIVESAEVGIRHRLVQVEMAMHEYDALLADLAEAQRALAAIEEPRRRLHVLQYAVAATQKLKRRQLHRVVQSIRDCLPRFASVMFSHEPNSRFVVAADDESLDLVCRRSVDQQLLDIPVKSFSGGEKQRLSVALVFTLHALLHARKRPDLLILDEVDRGLDDVGIASLMSLVRSVREQYGTVIMTSHRSQIAGAAFDRTWTVTKVNEESRLTTGGREC